MHPYHPNMRPRLYWRFLPNFVRKPVILGVVISFSAAAQQAPALANRGEPMLVGYPCVEEDLQWAGMSCDDQQPCPIYLELSAIAANGRKIIVAGNLHGDSATLASILLESDDDGATWKEPPVRKRGDVIDQIEFYDSQHAWAAGETQYPLPRDPFILASADGGSSWSEHAPGEEGAPGSVQNFWFDSPMHGEMIVDSGKSSSAGRYITYESDTGGASWELRGAGDKLPALKHGSSQADQDWRLHASKDGKAWQIDKREGETWSPVASFLIEVASCRIAPAKAGEPVP